jgi:hypothetical protein
MISPKFYRMNLSPDKAIRTLFTKYSSTIGRQFMKPFLCALGIYPSGTVIRLITNEYCVVVKQNQQSPSTPVLMGVKDSQGNNLQYPYEIADNYEILEVIPPFSMELSINRDQIWNNQVV